MGKGDLVSELLLVMMKKHHFKKKNEFLQCTLPMLVMLVPTSFRKSCEAHLRSCARARSMTTPAAMAQVRVK